MHLSRPVGAGGRGSARPRRDRLRRSVSGFRENGERTGAAGPYSFNPRNRSEFAMTDTELKLIAAAARMGLSRIPKTG